MKLSQVVFLVVCFCLIMGGFAGNFSSRPTVVNIGALLSSDSVIGRVAKVAIIAAVDDVNSDPNILPGTKLVVQVHDTNCSGSISVIQALQIMSKDEVVSMIGPQSSSTAHIISHVANVREVPLLSFAATDPMLSSLQYPFFVRTTQSDLFQMAALAELIYYYQWNQVIAIFTSDDYGSNGVASLEEKLQNMNCKISYKATLSPKATKSEIMNLLVKVALVESRVIVLHVHADIGFTILSLSHNLGMMSDGYVWIATDWLSSMLDSSASLGFGIINITQGVLALRQHTMDSRNKNSVVSSLNKLTKNQTNTNIQLNSYGLYAYDTVWAIAYGLDAFFNDSGMISFSNDTRWHATEKGTFAHDAMTLFDGGRLLLDKILKTDFLGVTGPVRFNSHGYLIHAAYDILNVVGTGFRTIGYWSDCSGLTVVSPETLYAELANISSINKQLYNAIWPGKTATKPRGWSFPKNGKELKIGVPRRVSFQELISIDTNTGKPKGYCIDVFFAAVNLLPYDIPYRFVPFGDGKVNPSYDQLIEIIASDVLDAAVGDITIVTNRTKFADFTQPYSEYGIAMLTSAKHHKFNAWAFLKPFTLGVWCVTGVSFVTVGLMVWILEHRINDEFRGPKRRQLCTAFWFSFSTLFFSHKERTKSTLGRSVLIIWLFVVLIIQSSYTASLSSIRTMQQLSSSIEGMDSLLRSKACIGFQVGSLIENYLVDVLGIPRSRLRPLGSPNEYAKALDLGSSKGGVSAIIDERPYIDSFLSTRCEFGIVSSVFTKHGWGFAFKRGSPLAVDMSNAILTLSENGDLQRIYEKWFSHSKCGSKDSGAQQIHLSSFSGLFIIVGSASFLAVVIYFSLALRQVFRQQSPEEPNSSGRGSSRRAIQAFFSYVDEKRPITKPKEGR